MSDGLSFRHATCVVQDQQGFMWIGTRNGLNRFDGYEFVHFTVNSKEGVPSLSGNYIHDLDIDQEGNIWIATNLGLDVLDPKDYTVKSYTPQEVFNGKEGIKTIDEITITKETGRIFIHSHQFQRFDRFYNTAEFRHGSFKELIFKDKGKTYEYIANVFEDSEDKLWARPAYSKTFYQLNQTFKVVSKTELPDSIGNYSLLNVVAPNEEQLQSSGPYKRNLEFIRPADGTLDLVGSFNDSHNTFMIRGNLKDGFSPFLQNFGLHGDQMPINDFIDQDGDVWLTHGTNIVVSSNGQTNYISRELINLEDNSVTYFYQSRDGTVWITTNFGVFRVLKEKNPFKFYLNIPDNERGYGSSMRGIEAGKNDHIIYSTVVSKGLWRTDRLTHESEQILPAEYVTDEKTFKILPYAIHYVDGVLWLCNWFDEGILKFHLQTGKLKHLHCEDNMAGFARSMVYDGKGQLWIGTDHGINVLDMETEELQWFKPVTNSNLLQNLDISALAVNSSGGIWVGTRENGLYQIGKDKSFEPVISKQQGLSGNSILSIHESGNTLWIGTSSGLNKFSIPTRENVIYNQNYGLPNNQINAINEMDGFIWLSTNKGLCRFNPAEESAVSYYKEDGLIHEEFNYSSFEKLSDGTLLFGGMNGIVEIPNQSVRQNKKPLDIILTGFQKSGTSSLSDLINTEQLSQSGIELDHNDKSFSLQFAYLDLFSSKHIKYKYILEGYDADWTLIGSENSVRFNKLPPGDYAFKVKALGNDGIWSDTLLSIPIHVHQVFYKSWWFMLLLMLLISGIVVSIILYRKKQREKLQLLRLKIASDLHDDVGGVIAQIGIQAELIKEGIYAEDQKEEQIKQIASNSRDAVQAMSDVLWTIDTRAEKMLDLVARMRSYALERLSTRNIEVKFTTDKLDDKQLDLNFRQNVYRAFKEMINNIMKHSNATMVKIHIEKSHQFILTVEDNGTDFKENHSPGQGLKNLQMRAERIGGKVIVTKENGYKIVFQV